MAGRSEQPTGKIQAAREADFDDRLWPITCIILMQAVFLATLVVALGDFAESRLPHNAWVQLAGVALVTGLLLSAVRWLQGKMLRRVQLSILISLLLHFWLAVYLHEQFIAVLARHQAESDSVVEEVPRVTLRDYHWQRIDQPEARQSFEKPLNSEQPKEQDPEALRRQELQREVPTQKEPPPQVEPPQRQQPNPTEIQRAELSAPRRAERPAGAQVSRQQWKHRPVANRPIPVPAIAFQEAPAALEAKAVQTQRRQTEVPQQQRRMFETEPAARNTQEAMKLARRASQTDELPQLPATLQAARQLAQPPEVTRTELTAPEPIAAVRPSRPLEPKPETTIARRSPNVPTGARRIPATVAAEPAEVAVAMTSRRRTEKRPRLARLAATAASRQPRRAEVPSGVEESQPPMVASSSPGQIELDPARSQVSQPTAAAVADRAADRPADIPAAAAPTAVTRNPPRLPRRVSDPRLRPRASGTLRIARAAARGGSSTATSPVPEVAGDPAVAMASGTAVSEHISLDSRATAAGRSRKAALPAGGPSAGSGPSGESGTPGRVGTALLSRVTRREDVPSGLSGGRSSMPSRSVRGAVLPGAGEQAPQIAATTPGGGDTPGTSLEDTVATGGVGRTVGGPSGGLDVGSPAMLNRTSGGGTSIGNSAAGSLRVTATVGGARARGDAVPTLATGAPGGRPGRSISAAPVLAGIVGGTPHPASDAGPSGSTGTATDSPAETDSAGPQRQETGLAGDFNGQTPVDDATLAGPAAATAAVRAGPRRTPSEPTARTLALGAEVGGGPLERTNTPGLPQGLTETIQPHHVPGTPGVEARPQLLDLAGGAGIGEPSRQEVGLPVQIIAMAGPGGLSYDPSPEPGIPSRRARPESEFVHTVSRRFVIQRSGGQLAIDGHLRELPAEAFRRRDPGRRAQAARTYGGTEGTERAVEMGLDFLARHQFPDGRWSLDRLPTDGPGYEDAASGQMQSDSGATGLALLSFLGAGYTHLEDKHRAVVQRGIDFLLRNQKPDGDLFSGGTKYAWYYSHGIATIALCEAYGMTRDPDLREPARNAIEFIIASQHPTQGGWRYRPRTETDTSVSGWQLMALKSAQMAGLEVPEEVLEKVGHWLDGAGVRDGSRYVYNPNAPDSRDKREGRQPNRAMTAEGLLMRMYLGWDHRTAGMEVGAEYLKANLPQVGTRERPLRDSYYWYYATQVMFQMQGEHWRAWNDRLHPLLENSQTQSGPLAGSWHPTRWNAAEPVPDRWGHAGGRLYVTAVHLLMLEVYYRHLPLYQTLAQ